MAVSAALVFSNCAYASGSHAGGHDAANIGAPGVAANVSRARQGETIRFVIKNTGKLSHEFVLGTAKELKDHYEEMKKNPGMEHADVNMLTVKPGSTGELLWQFTQAGTVSFACLHVGHYDAGMKGTVRVTKK